MMIHPVLFLCFLSGISSGHITLYTASEGQSISFEFPFTQAANSRRYLCKGECTEEGSLITTHHATAQVGRYSLRYHEGLFEVTIENLTKSDSGQYRCGVRSPFLPDCYEELIEIRVTEAQPPVEITKLPEQWFTEETRHVTEAQPSVEITKLSEQRSSEGTRHDTEDLTTFSTTIKQFEWEQTEDTTATVSHLAYPLVVGICAAVVAVVVALLAVFLLLLHKWKTNKGSDGLNTREKSDNTNTEFVTYENWDLATWCDSTYQSLDPASRDQDQLYFTFT
ncbi:CMRF35-like molecule 8 isoform X3 [Seriola dumerili]|uniref:CMRF35-like molecule 8 isoform X3 n=1 Tax=Seriola dumerili TaxID=41447 RepID=UPI000BBEEF64|nr:CMRF35-like molecule 8 isoform X3 [Seriola dumerili]